MLETVIVAFSMFSRIPMPHIEWNEKNMRYAMAAFPFIGIVIGGLLLLADFFCVFFGIPGMLRGAILFCIPLAVTGGIHLDGFADTSDAIASRQTREKKLEILKDPHIGSFAVIAVAVYLIVSFALWCEMPGLHWQEILPMFFLSRSLSGLAVASFPLAKDSGLLYAFSSEAVKGRVKWILLIFVGGAVGLLCSQGAPGIAMSIAALLWYVYYYVYSKRVFGGITGDLAGWFLSVAEVLMLFVLEVFGKWF